MTTDVNPGDVCFIRSSAWNVQDGQATIGTVTRLTPKQIVTETRHGERRFWRKDLTEVGSVANAPTGLMAVGHGTTTLVPPSSPDFQRIREARRRLLLRVRVVREMEAAIKSPEDVEAVAAAIKRLGEWQTYLSEKEGQ